MKIKDWSDITVCRAVALHKTNQSLIPDPENKAKNNLYTPTARDQNKAKFRNLRKKIMQILYHNLFSFSMTL